MFDTDTKIAWACRRGMLELDLLLEPFFKQCFAKLDASKQAAFRQLLLCNDQELFDWFLKDDEPADTNLKIIIAEIKQHAEAKY